MAGLKLIALGREYLEDILKLEPQIYSHCWSQQLISVEFDKPISRRYGLLKDDKLIGYSFNYVVEDEFHLLNLGIDPFYQGAGFGGKLLDHVIKSSRDLSCRIILLEVRRSNLKAQKLYHAKGFKSDGIRPKYYSDNQEDAILMSLVLS